jgi:anthranilate phosphoribosyltransferase
VFSSDWLVPYAEALKALGSERAWIVHGRDGLDELSISGPPDRHLDQGTITTGEVTPEEAGLSAWPLADIAGGNAAHNAAAPAQSVGRQASGAYHQIVLLTAAAALNVAGKAQRLAPGRRNGR